MGSRDNKWIQHVRNYQANNPGTGWQQALKEASPSYWAVKQQTGGMIRGSLLSTKQLQKMVSMAVGFLGEEQFYGIDPDTIIDLMNLLFKIREYSDTVYRISESSTASPWAQSISSISFQDGPEGVRNDMEKVFAAIDQRSDSLKIYQTLCTVYRDILFDSTGVFSQIVGTLYPGTPDQRDAFKTKVIDAIQTLNYAQLADTFYDLPVTLQELIKEPESLREDLNMILSIIANRANLGTIVRQYLDPVMGTAVDTVQQVVPLMFAMVILLEQCGNGISEAQAVALDSLVPTRSSKKLKMLGNALDSVATAATVADAAASGHITESLFNLIVTDRKAHRAQVSPAGRGTAVRSPTAMRSPSTVRGPSASRGTVTRHGQLGQQGSSTGKSKVRGSRSRTKSRQPGTRALRKTRR